MARQKFEKSFNTFVKGLMTEASEINFPEDFSLYEKNFLLHRDGGRDRRKGMELMYPLGMTLTSTPYPVTFEDSIGVSTGVTSVYDNEIVRRASGDEGAGVGSGATWMRLRSTLFELEAVPEDLGVESGAQRINLKKVRSVYEHDEPEEVTITSGVGRIYLNRVAVRYTEPLPEELNVFTGIARINLNAN